MFRKPISRGLLATLVATMLAGPAMADSVLPTGLAPGSKYQIMFVTSAGTTATSTNIATYNNFVTQQADQSPTLAGLGATWTAVVSTSTFSASNASSTTNVPIYDTHGDLLEPNFHSLFSDTNFSGPDYSQTGSTVEGYTWSGFWIYNNYLESNSYAVDTLGTGTPIVGYHGQTNYGWICDAAVGLNSYSETVYAISSPVTVVPEPTTLTLLIPALLGLGGFWLVRRRHAATRSGSCRGHKIMIM